MRWIIYALTLCLIWMAPFNQTPLFAKQKEHFDKYGGWTGLKGKATGCFHTEKIGGRWWIITPEGNIFWLVSMYCVRFGGLPETKTGKRAYKNACLKKYGNEAKWSEATKFQLKNWGFNTISDWSSESVYKRGNFVYVMGIDLPRDSENVIPKGSYGYFPDVFSQEFRNSINERMEKKFKRQPYLIDDPWLLGYFLADEPSWYGSKGKGSLTDDFIRLDKAKPGKVAWVNYIKSRYQNVEELNNQWKTNFKNLDELLTTDIIKNTPRSKEDKLGFIKVVAEEFSKGLHDEFKKFDKNHMILGTRPTRLYPEVVEGIGKYSDVFTMSSGGLYQGYKINSKFSEKIDEIHQYAKKPLLLGVLISAQDMGLPYGKVKTQRDRGISYWRYLAKVASHPAIVGLQWFQYFDPPRKCYDKRAANWGLVNDQDEPYEDAVELISQANSMVYAYALGLSDFTPEFDKFFGVKKTKTPEMSKKDSSKKVSIPIQNSGFEQGKDAWKFQTWKGKSKVSIDGVTKHSGRRALKIEGGPDEGWGSVGVGLQDGPDFSLTPDYQYKLSAWIKTKDLEDFAFVRIKVKYESGDAAYFRTESIYGTEDWKLVKIEFTPNEENKVVYLGAQLVGRGTAWFDDISLEVIKE